MSNFGDFFMYFVSFGLSTRMEAFIYNKKKNKQNLSKS